MSKVKKSSSGIMRVPEASLSTPGPAIKVCEKFQQLNTGRTINITEPAGTSVGSPSLERNQSQQKEIQNTEHIVEKGNYKYQLKHMASCRNKDYNNC